MRVYPIAVLTCLVVFFSCKKHATSDDFGQGTGRCRILGFTDYYGNDSSLVTLIYDKYNRLSLIDFGNGGHRSFTYYGNAIVAATTGIAAPVIAYDSAITDGNGRVVARYTQSIVYAPMRKYEYDASGQIVAMVYGDNAGTIYGTDKYYWNDGDVYPDTTNPLGHFRMNTTPTSRFSTRVGNSLVNSWNWAGHFSKPGTC